MELKITIIILFLANLVFIFSLFNLASINNFVRGLTPIPGAQSRLNDKYIKIQKTKIINERVNKSNFNPGQVVDMSKEKLFIQTGNGLISITHLQLEGKKSLDIKSFLNGYNLNIGDYFGN